MDLFDADFFDELTEKAKGSPRLRINHNLHSSYSDPCQRVLVAIEPGSYVQPHRHLATNKSETFVVLRGRIALVRFNDEGEVVESKLLSSDGCPMAELAPVEWHTVISLDSGSIFFEAKQGPYDPEETKEPAPFAPDETDDLAKEYLVELVGLVEEPCA